MGLNLRNTEDGLFFHYFLQFLERKFVGREGNCTNSAENRRKLRIEHPDKHLELRIMSPNFLRKLDRYTGF